MRRKRIAVAVGANTVLFLIATQLNAWIAPWSLHLFIEGVYLLFPAFYLRFGSALCTLAAAALFLDATAPWPFGTRFFLYAGVLLFLRIIGRRIRRERGLHLTFMALLATLLLYLAEVLLSGNVRWGAGVFWGRLGTDLLFSFLVVYVIAFRFVEAQRQILFNLGINVAAEPARGQG